MPGTFRPLRRLSRRLRAVIRRSQPYRRLYEEAPDSAALLVLRVDDVGTIFAQRSEGHRRHPVF